MKILETLMLLYQYAYYAMVKWDKFTWRGRLSEKNSKYKAIFFLGAVELFAIFAVYMFIANVVLGFPIHKEGSSDAVVWFISLIAALVMFLFNRWLLGSKEQLAYYKNKFDHWDRWKRARWSIYVILIAISTFVILLFVGGASQKVLQP